MIVGMMKIPQPWLLSVDRTTWSFGETTYIVATKLFRRECNRSIFEMWLETCLIPNLKPGQVVIGDNATFHKGGRIRELAERWGDVQFIVRWALILISQRYLYFLSCTQHLKIKTNGTSEYFCG